MPQATPPPAVGDLDIRNAALAKLQAVIKALPWACAGRLPDCRKHLKAIEGSGSEDDLEHHEKALNFLHGFSETCRELASRAEEILAILEPPKRRRSGVVRRIDAKETRGTSG